MTQAAELFPSALADAPSEVARIFADAAGTSPDAESESGAWQAVHRAGWYDTDAGWKQLTPDLRPRINMARPVKQPNGKYVIRGVTVFMPNAAKGTDAKAIYTPERVQRIAENTNEITADSGQRPAVVIDHPTPEQAALGIFKSAFGTGVNFRPSQRFPGKFDCDLIDVTPEAVDKWKRGEIVGLSAGIVADDAGTNERIGHIALLGGRSSQLSGLNVTELMSVHPSNCVMFAAGDAPLPSAPAIPNADRSPKMDLSKIKAANAKFSAAFAAFEAGEPDAEKKLKEAQDDMASACNYAISPDAAADIGAQRDDAEEPKPKTGIYKKSGMKGNWHLTYAADGTPGFEADSLGPDQGGVADTVADPSNEPVAGGAKAATAAFEAKTVAQFDALTTDLKAKDARINELTGVLGRMAAERLTVEFKAHLDTLKTAGHQFDADATMVMFAATAGEPAKIDALKVFLAKTPKQTPLESIPAHNPAESGVLMVNETSTNFDAQAIANRLQDTLDCGPINPAVVAAAYGAAIKAAK